MGVGEKIRDWIHNLVGDEFTLRDFFRLSTNPIGELMRANSLTSLEATWDRLPEREKENPKVQAAYEDWKKKLEPKEDLGVWGSGFREILSAAAAGLGELDDLAGGTIADLILESGKNLTGVEPSPKTREILEGTDISEAYRGAISYCADIIIETTQKGGKELDDYQRERVEDALRGLITLFGGSAAAIAIPATIGDLFHPTKETNLGRAVNLMYEMVGFRALRDAVLGPLKRGLIEQPLRYQWNEILQPWYPSFRDSHEAFGRGHIGDTQFRHQMQIAGIKEREEDVGLDFFQMYKRASAAPSSYFMLNAIGREGLYDREKFKFWLSDAGFGAFEVTEDDLSEYEKEYGLKPPGQSQIDFLADMYAKMHVRTFVGDPRSLWKKFYADGKVSRKEYEDWLATHGITPEDAKEALDALDEEYAWDVKKEYQKTYEKRYLYGRVDVDGLRKSLEDLGLRKDYIDARIERLTVQKEGKVTEEKLRTLTKAEVLRMYRNGLIERGEAYARLDTMGYEPEDIELLLREQDQKIQEKLEKEMEKEEEEALSTEK